MCVKLTPSSVLLFPLVRRNKAGRVLVLSIFCFEAVIVCELFMYRSMLACALCGNISFCSISMLEFCAFLGALRYRLWKCVCIWAYI